MSALTVRAYNVLFGDAILVSVPDRDPRIGLETQRHILIDVGNVLGGEGGKDDVFEPVVRDIRRRLGKWPIDLYVMTHEHLDHVQGLPYAAGREVELDVDYAWLTASSGPGYYKRHPEARRRRLMVEGAYYAIKRHLAANPSVNTPWMKALMINNNPSRTKSCVAYLRKLARKHTRYVHCETKLRYGKHHPFREAKLTILAPEKDTSSYYGQMRPLLPAGDEEEAGANEESRQSTYPEPPTGVDPQAFQRLLENWSSGISSNVLAIDKAANNTSIVLMLEWRGWRLLFAGDAELRSWRMMAHEDERKPILKPVHLLKVGHHGSHNATPPDPILEMILPLKKPDDRKRVALISTYTGPYSGVPHGPTVERLEARCDRIMKTNNVTPGKSVHISFKG